MAPLAAEPLGRREPGFHSRPGLQPNGTVRVELPYACRCTGCLRTLGKGVRFNAAKVRVGAYFSTPLWEFRMKCPTCKRALAFATDPEHRGYRLVDGLERLATRHDADAADGELPVLEDMGVFRERAAPRDAMAQLEHETEDRRRAAANQSRLEELLDRNDAAGAQDAAVNAALRADHREGRRQRDALAAAASSMGWGAHVPLLGATDADAGAARRLFASRPSAPRPPARKRRASLFPAGVYDGGVAKRARS